MAGRLHTFQLADWITPLPAGALTGRGRLGHGTIGLREWKGYVEAAGYTGWGEAELFNEGLWQTNGRTLLEETAARFTEYTS